MLDAYTIQNFKSDLEKKTNEDIIDFFIELGNLLRVGDPEEIDNETVLRTVELLYAIHEKFFSIDSNSNLSEDIENVFIECKATSAVLRRKLKTGQLDKDYFIDVSDLGRQIINLSNLLTILGISFI